MVCGALALALAACAETQLVANSTKLVTTPNAPPRPPVYKIGKPYQLEGIWYYPKVDYSYDESGIASWYGSDFNGKPTASGEIYDQNGLTAAHRTLPMPTIIQVTNLENGRSLKLRVNDRGPFARGRLIDVSQRAAQLLGFIEQGTARVRVQVIADESQALAAALSGGTMVPEGEPQPTVPTPAPTVPVTEANLSTLSARLPAATGSSSTTASSAVAAAPVAAPPATPAIATPPAPSSMGSTVTAPSAATSTYGPADPPGTPSIVHDKTGGTATTPASASSSTMVAAATPAPAKPVTPAPAMTTPTTIAPATTATTVAPASGGTVVAATKPTAGLEPSGKVTQVPVKPSSIFIQAGAFTKRQNAETLTAELKRLGHATMIPVKVGGQQFYRVRLGPLSSVTEADRLLDELVRSGHPEARIVVD